MDKQRELISWQRKPELNAWLKFACSAGIVAGVGASIFWPVFIVPLVTFGLSAVLWFTVSPRLGLSLGVVAFCLYAPYGWVLTEGNTTWMNLWPILPGGLVGMFLASPITLGLATLFQLAFFTKLGSSGGLRLAVAGQLAFALSMAQTFYMYSLYRS